MAVPTRSTPQAQVDAWNAEMRAHPAYLQFMQQNGLSSDGRVKLSGSQQAGLERALQAAGMRVPSGMHIDQGGNLNQKNRLVRNTAIGAGVTGAALTGFGLAGMGPLGGALGGGSAAAGAGGGGVLASHSLPTATLMGGPAAITSGAVSAGIPLGGLAAGALPVGALMGGPAAIASQGISHGVGGDTIDGSGIGNLLDKDAGGSSIGRKILNSLISPGGAVGLAGVIGALMAKNNSGGGGDIGSQYPQLNELLNIQTDRVKRTDPLHQALTQSAMNRMPVNVQQGPITNGPPTRWTPTKVG